MLSARQQSILNRVVDIYIDTAQPVGSKQITEIYTELYSRSYSPATVRHEMGLLEERGYLTHPHTSAGRIPTDRGYRYYVDYSLREELPEQDMMETATQRLVPAVGPMEDLAEKISQLLSELSSYVSVVVIPDETRRKKRAFVQGSSRLLDQPEFQDAQTIKPLLKILENSEALQACLPVGKESVSIRIGEENTAPEFKQCAVVASCLNSEKLGTLAVIGPRRMKYSRMIPLMNRMGWVVETLVQSGRFV